MSPAFVISAIVAVAAIIAALMFLRSDDEAADGVPAPVDGEPVPTVSAATDLAGDAADGLAGDDQLAANTAVEPGGPGAVASFFQDWVDGDRAWTVAYPSPMGLQLLSAAGTVQPKIEVAAGFEEAARLPLISDGSRSWAIDPSQQSLAWLVSTQFFVTDVDREGRVAFINDSLDPPNIGESSFGAWGPGFDLPVDAKVLPVPGRGLFVLPATGGTYEYELNGVKPFSDDVLVAASIDSEVFQRCDQELTCELYLSRPSSPDPLPLRIEVGSELWPSPGGEWVVVREPSGFSWLNHVDTGSDPECYTRAVECQRIEGTVRAVDWSDDASLVAVLTRDELIVMRPDTGESRSVTLPIAPSANAVLLASE